jgi:hypothetical protein
MVFIRFDPLDHNLRGTVAIEIALSIIRIDANVQDRLESLRQFQDQIAQVHKVDARFVT